MNNFREFLTAPCQKDENQVGKWDVVLFTGSYNPITNDEHDRIRQFVQNIIRNDNYKNLFSPVVEIGLIFDEEETDLVRTETEMILNNDEKNYITTKFFGLRGFPISYRRLKWLTLPIPDKDKLPFNASLNFKNIKDDMLTMYYPALENIKKNFDQVNVLIVINPEEPNALPELDHIVTNFEDDTIKIGFMSWRHIAKDTIKELGDIPVLGDMIKSIVLMDHDRPEPENLKSFAYKYGLKDLLENIRTVHFRVGGEYYLQAFMTLFPEMILYHDDETNVEYNYRVVMEILKKMYYKEKYVSSYMEELESEASEVPIEAQAEEAPEEGEEIDF